MKIGSLLAHVRELETQFAGELRAAAERHRDDHDVYHQCHTFAVTADKRIEKLEPLARRYGGQAEWKTAIGEGSDELLEDLRALYLRAEDNAITWVMLCQAAKAARDQELLTLATECQAETEMQGKWFTTRIKTGAPQALVVA
jgi:histidinol-phosphate/aromatic aminotransferase/cobyric acid decarboxylase-like protein